MLYRIKVKLIRILYHYILGDNIKCAQNLGVRIGKKCRILDDPGKVFGSEPWMVTVGDKCELTHGVRIITHEGGLWVARNLCKELENADIIKEVRIGNNVMIGMGSIIMPGVVIEDNVIVGSHSVVTKRLESGYVYAGIPAKKIKSMDEFISDALNSDGLMHTKKMNPTEKRKYIENYYDNRGNL